MALRFIFGGRRDDAERSTERENEMDEEALSEVGDLEENVAYYEDALNEVYFTNPGFDGSSFRAPSASPSPSLRLTKRQFTRRMSSRLREHKRVPSVDASEIDVDMVLAPSAFAFHNVPSAAQGNSFCSRDDSEIATRTMLQCLSRNDRLPSGKATPYANAAYLSPYAYDDSEVGSCTLEKPIRLRHMGSALSYRLEMSGTPEGSFCLDDDVSAYTGPRHARGNSDMSERVASFKERNKMIRLDSLVGGVEKADSSVLEFGLLNPDALHALQSQPTPRLFRSTSDKEKNAESSLPDMIAKNPVPMQRMLSEMEASRVESFPITFLDNIVEEEEDVSEFEYHIDETKSVIINDNQSESSLSSPSLFAPQDFTRSRFKVSVTQPEMAKTEKDKGYVNPAFESEIETPKTTQRPSSKVPLLRLKSIERQKSKKKREADKAQDLSFLNAAPSRRREKRDESLHTALMERYLLQSVVNKYLIES